MANTDIESTSPSGSSQSGSLLSESSAPSLHKGNALSTQRDTDVSKYDDVVDTTHDIPDVPSAAWGWSGESPKAMRVASWLVAVILLCMLVGNQVGHIEDLYLIGFAVFLAFIMVMDTIRRRRPH